MLFDDGLFVTLFRFPCSALDKFPGGNIKPCNKGSVECECEFFSADSDFFRVAIIRENRLK